MHSRAILAFASVALAVVALGLFALRPRAAPPMDPALEAELAQYREALAALRSAHDTRPVPQDRFYLFGMGDRPKLLFKDGVLSELLTGAVVRSWDARSVEIVPSAYAVTFATGDGRRVTIAEDERGVRIEDGETQEWLSRGGDVKLPRFDGNPYAPILRTLHQEILVNIVDERPLPNILGYDTPWYRDGAMVAMTLVETGNLDLIDGWIAGIRDPFDRNNGEEEADNPGEVLYLASLAGGVSHPVVERALAAAARFERDGYIVGRTDHSEHALYQTQWMKFGLASLGLPDPYVSPDIRESYGSLAWWMPTELTRSGDRHSSNAPYLAWAAHHSDRSVPGVLPDREYPLSYEADASQADYARMAVISPAFTDARITMPHTWHAAEMFLFLLHDEAR